MTAQDQSSGARKDLWDKLSILGNVIAATIVAGALGLAGHWISLSLGNRELDVKIMSLAVDILQTDPAATGQGIRGWALAVLQRLSGVEIPGQAGEELLNQPLGIIQLQDETTAGETDLDVFVCEQDQGSGAFAAQSALANRAGEKLAAAGFGRVRSKVWGALEEFPLDQLRGATTIIFDVGHPEEQEVELIERTLAEVPGLPAVRRAANPGALSPWYISVVICPQVP